MIDEMQAGREMDALIAEKVFGWSEVAWNKEIDAATGRMPTKTGGMDGFGFSCIPRYSENISAAWEVIGKIRELDYHWHPWVYWDEDEHGQGFWVGSFTYYGETEEEYKILQDWDETAPLAICRAALKVLGVS